MNNNLLNLIKLSTDNRNVSPTFFQIFILWIMIQERAFCLAVCLRVVLWARFNFLRHSLNSHLWQLFLYSVQVKPYVWIPSNALCNWKILFILILNIPTDHYSFPKRKINKKTHWYTFFYMLSVSVWYRFWCFYYLYMDNYILSHCQIYFISYFFYH
jgi:hypothetical protein